MGMALPAGGHLTHGWNVSATGKWFRAVQYGVRRDTHRIDLDEVRDLARKERPKLIFCGGTAIPRTIDFAGVRRDRARGRRDARRRHRAHRRPVAGGAHPSPVGHADVVTTTTHKTLRGPRGGMLMCTATHQKAIDRPCSPACRAARTTTPPPASRSRCSEARAAEFKRYAHADRRQRAGARGGAASSAASTLVTGGTDNHLILVDLTTKDVAGKLAAQALDRAGIELNYNTVPFDPRKPFDPSGIRLGTPAVTSRGMGGAEMRQIAAWMDEVVAAVAKNDEDTVNATTDRVEAQVRELTADFPAPGLPV